MSHALQIQESKSVSLFPSEHEWAILKEQAAMVVKTGFLPAAIKTAEQAIAIALKGRELGIPPMQAFAHIHIIQGKPTISAELMLSLIYKNCPGAVVDYIENSNEICVIEAKRPGGSTARFSFSMEDAKRADLLGKGNWKAYPGAMLRARAIAIMARARFPDAIMGCSYTPEELGADVNEDGEVINVPSVTEPPAAMGPAPSPAPKPLTIAPKKEAAPLPRMTRTELGAAILKSAADIRLSTTDMVAWIEERYKKTMQSMTTAEMEDFYGVLESEKLSEGVVS